MADLIIAWVIITSFVVFGGAFMLKDMFTLPSYNDALKAWLIFLGIICIMAVAMGSLVWSLTIVAGPK